jgi:hypothetical protein
MSRLDDVLKGAIALDKTNGSNPHQMVNMMYADPGTGKTVLTAKLAQRLRSDTGKILFLDSMEGFVTLEEQQYDDLRQGVIRVRVDNPRDLVPIADGLQRNVPKLRSVEVVILDEFSSWVKRIAEAYVRDLHNTDPADMMPTIEGHDWGPIGALSASILTQFIASGRHVLIVAHSRLRGGDDDAGGKGGKFTPNFTPLLGLDIQGMVHQTTLMTARLAGRGQYERTLHTRPSASIQAKSRIEGMPMNPTEKQYLDLTAAWAHGEIGNEKPVTAAKAARTKAAEVIVPEDAPLEGDDELDQSDQPVVADED